MVHSVELLFDHETEAAIRSIWDGLTAAGVKSLASNTASSNRPHVTLTVAEQMDDAVNAALVSVVEQLPFECRIGAPMVFGYRTLTLVRSLVPSVTLLSIHAAVHRACLPHMPTGPLPHARPGNWTPHVTLALRLAPDRLATAMSLPQTGRDLTGTVTGLRHWDGNSKREYPIN